MKNAILLFALLLTSTLGFSQVEWKELDDFHGVMSQTFHPAEEGNLKPIKERAGEMALKAKALKQSAVPASLQTPELKKLIVLLAKESAALSKLVAKNAADADILKSLTALHDRFHQVAEECHD